MASTHLDYTGMIFQAVDALSQHEVVNQASISSYINAHYPDLPPAHSTILSTALDKMCQSGQLIFANNVFARPDPDAPPKRGRGRPPKARSGNTPPPPVNLGPTRGRGRPPKQRDPLAPPPQPKKKVPTASSGRPRGRPRKDPESVTISAAPVSAGSGVKRGRGRPRKNA